MRRLPVLAILAALPLCGLAVPAVLAQSAGTQSDGATSAEARVEASRKALEAAQASLQQAEDTGGDIRSARKSLANAMKSLRAAELAAGMAPGTGAEASTSTAVPSPAATLAPAPRATEAPQTAPAGDAQAAAAPPPPAAAVIPDGPRPYVPPTVAKEPEPAPGAPTTATTASAAGVPIPPRKPAPPPRTTAAATPPAQAGRPAMRAPMPPQIVRYGRYTETTYTHPDGSKTIDVTNRRGILVRRIEVDRRGNELVVIDQERPGWRQRPRWGDGYQYVDPRRVPPPPGYDGY